MDNQLELMNEIESCYVTDYDPPKAAPKTTNEPNIFEEKAEEGEHDHYPSWEGLGHQETTLTAEFIETKNVATSVPIHVNLGLPFTVCNYALLKRRQYRSKMRQRKAPLKELKKTRVTKIPDGMRYVPV